MEDERVISFERGKQLADSLGLEFFETSAKENINVRVSFHLNYKWGIFDKNDYIQWGKSIAEIWIKWKVWKESLHSIYLHILYSVILWKNCFRKFCEIKNERYIL